MKKRLQLWLVVASVLLGPILLGAPAGYAGDYDHLKCYSIRDPLRIGDIPVQLENQFGTEQCLIQTPAKLLCAETVKVTATNPDGDDERRQGPVGHYLGYLIKGCPTPLVNDQFRQRVIKIKGGQYLLTPAIKNPVP